MIFISLFLVKKLEDLKGGLGITLDDVGAGSANEYLDTIHDLLVTIIFMKLTKPDISRIIEMCWEDRTPF